MSDLASHVDGVELGCSGVPNEGKMPTAARGVADGSENKRTTSLKEGLCPRNGTLTHPEIEGDV